MHAQHYIAFSKGNSTTMLIHFDDMTAHERREHFIVSFKEMMN